MYRTRGLFMDGKKLLILGAGQYGHVAMETAKAMGIFEEIAFLDDRDPHAVGRLADFSLLKQSYGCAVVAMGNPTIRLYWLNELEQAGFEIPVLVHPRACIAPSARLGKGTIAEPMAVVNTEAVVETGCLLCAGCVVNHNARVLPGCQVDCNAVVSSNAVVPQGTKVQSCCVFKKE